MQGTYGYYPFFDEIGVLGIGGRLGYGVSNNYTIKLKAEAIQEVSKGRLNTRDFFFSFENKIKLPESMRRDKRQAISLDCQMYTHQKLTGNLILNYYAIGGSYYFTKTNEANTVDFSGIYRIFYTNYNGYYTTYNDPFKNILMSYSIGIGLSTNLDKWAIRPEFCFSPFPSIGIGLTYKIGGNSDDDTSNTPSNR